MDEEVPSVAADVSINLNDTTSPCQLQEVTLDPDGTFANSMVSRSPNGPVRGRSVREFEEQLTNLKKENFNLKLRIYFLEERMGTNFKLDKESAVKKNIELMVEVESLRKEIQEKQDLLCQAVKAMELEEDEHKKETIVKEQQLSDFKEQIEDLQQKLKEARLEYENRTQKADVLLNSADFLYAKSFQPVDENTSDIVNQLQQRVAQLEHELVKEKENSGALENLLRLADCASVRCKSLEEENQQKDEKINELHKELHEFAKKISGYNLRIQTLEDELGHSNTELNYKTNELQTVQHEIKNQLIEVEHLKKLLSQCQLMYEAEQRKGEKLKAAVMARNSKVIELENLGETQKAKIRNLETRLESAQNEVKRKTDELEAIKSPVRRQKPSNTDDHSFSVQNSSAVSGSPNNKKDNSKTPISPKKSRSPSASSRLSSPIKSTGGGENLGLPPDVEILVEENKKYKQNVATQQQKILKLKSQQVKACEMIKALLNSRGDNEKETEFLKKRIQQLEEEITKMKEEIKSDRLNSSNSAKSLHTKVSEMNFTAGANPASENEKSMTEAAEYRQLNEQYKALSSELEKQVEILLETVKEKDMQMDVLKQQLKEVSEQMKLKHNKIVDLEFELLSSNHEQFVQSAAGEKQDNGNEKPSSFWITEIEDKDKEIERLENELRKRTCDLQGIVNKELWEKNREIEKMQNRYRDIINNKEQEILKLEKDIVSKDLQLKILKDKINELGIHVNLPSNFLSPIKLDISAPENKKTLKEQLKLCTEERKHLLQQIEELKTKLRNTPEREVNKELQQLKTEYNDLREELEKSEKLRNESNEICSVLSRRLEELAQFLNSLLKQKSVLGFLGTKQNSKLQEFIDQSLDISRTLNMTLSLNPDQSLMQLSNISNLLNSSNDDSKLNDLLDEDDGNNSILSIIPGNVTLTYQSHLHKVNNDEKQDNEKDQIIKVLREQVENLKQEIELRDTELNHKLTTVSNSDRVLENDQEFVEAVIDLQAKSLLCKIPPKNPEKIYEELMSEKSAMLEKAVLNTTSTTLKNQTDNHSESESWSEPDRSVSMARIGLDDESLKPHSSTKRKLYGTLSSESTEDEGPKCLSRTPSKKNLTADRQAILLLHEQISEMENKLQEKDNHMLAAQVAFFGVDNQLKEEKISKGKYKKQIDELMQNLQIAEEKIAACEIGRQEAEQKVDQLNAIVNDLQEVKNALEEKMECKDKVTQNKINLLEIEKDQALKAAKMAEKVAEKATETIKATEMELKNMENEVKAMEMSIRIECKEETAIRLIAAEREFEIKMKSAEQNAETQIKRIKHTFDKMQIIYQNDYIKKCEVDRRILEVETIIKDLENLKIHLKSAEQKMQLMERNESDLRFKLQTLEKEHYEKINNLRKELDSATLQYSEAVLEKTKIANEKAFLEQELKKFDLKENDLMKQVGEFQDEFNMMKQNFNKQVANIENQKSKLEVKVSELESKNAELRNKLIKIQSGHGDHGSYSTSLPNSPNRFYDLFGRNVSTTHSQPQYRRQFSDNSGYTSEEQACEEHNRRAHIYSDHIIHNVIPVDIERHQANSSPDLGIESDHGRFSSLEANVNVPRPLLQTLELTESMSNLLDGNNEPQHSSCGNEQCCLKVKEMVNENTDLKRRLLRTRRALEETVTQLTLANQRKKQVEKTICKQIHKTSQVLRKAKANLDSGSETELRRN